MMAWRRPTKKQIRHGAALLGVSAGLAGVLAGVLSLFGSVRVAGAYRDLDLGRGAVRLQWHGQARTVVVASPGAGAAPITDVESHRFDKLGAVKRSPSAGLVMYTERGFVPAVQVVRGREVLLTRADADLPWLWLPAFDVRDRSATSSTGYLIVPVWLPVLLGAVCLYTRLAPDAAPGTCRKCGFDLSGVPALPDDAARVRCPECGQVGGKGLERVKNGR
jgi:hypothetical protein